jgi:hypothetical protein
MSSQEVVKVVSVTEINGGLSIKFNKPVDEKIEWPISFPGLSGKLFEMFRDGLMKHPTFRITPPMIFTNNGVRKTIDQVHFDRLNLLRALRANANNQRPMTSANVMRLRQIHAEGQWGTSSDRIHFRNGQLTNGQHRTFVCVLEGVDSVFDVLIDATDQDLANGDGQAPRKKYDNASMLGQIQVDYDKIPPRGIVWSALAMLFELARNHPPNTPQDYSEVYNQFRESLEFWGPMYKFKSSSRKLIQESNVLAAMLIAHHKYKAKISKPIQDLITPHVPKEETAPLKKLFDYLNRDGGHNKVVERERLDKIKNDADAKDKGSPPTPSVRSRIVFKTLHALKLHLEDKTVAKKTGLKYSPDILTHYYGVGESILP